VRPAAPLALFAFLTACPSHELGRARDLEAAGKLEEAGKLYVEIAKRDPANLGAWDGAVEVFCRKLGNVGECMSVLDLELDQLGKLDRHKSALAEVLEQRARVRTEQGLVDAALADLERAERAGPPRSSLYAARARALIHLGQREPALQALERARELDPKNAEVDELVAQLPEEETFGGPAP
jgi:tetratricopeptide (TPR) repeat protein